MQIAYSLNSITFAKTSPLCDISQHARCKRHTCEIMLNTVQQMLSIKSPILHTNCKNEIKRTLHYESVTFKMKCTETTACMHNLITNLTGILGLAKQTELSTTKWPPETNYKQLATNQLPVITLHGNKIKHLKQCTLRIRKIHKMFGVFHRQYIHTCSPSCYIQTHKEWAWHKVDTNFFVHIQQPDSAQQPKCTFFVTMLLSVC